VCRAAGRIDVRTVRNASTRAFLTEWGVSGEIAVVPDPVVLWAGAGPPRRSRGQRKRIGVLVARPVFPLPFLMEMARWAVQSQVHSNPSVVSLEPYSGAATYDEPQYVRRYGDALRQLSATDDLEICSRPSMYSDEQTARLVAAELGGRASSVRVHDPWGADLLAWMETLDCVIASRFHDCLLALLAGTPVVAVDPYAGPTTPTTKLRELMRTGQGLDHYVPMDSFLDGTIPLPDRIESARAAAPCLPEVLQSLQMNASAHFDAVVEALA
jgi:polysaccharide pyruvyl transferase WcaK-like protein